MLGGGPAFSYFVQFYQDAIALWKKGDKGDAAFILGRAVHLMEDMAQPQHASDESHPSLPLDIKLKPSFLEYFTEHYLPKANGAVNGGDCEAERADYASLIASCQNYEDGGSTRLFNEMTADSTVIGNSFRGESFTYQQLNQYYGTYAGSPGYPPWTPLTMISGVDVSLPFQDKAACSRVPYYGNVGPSAPKDYKIPDGVTSSDHALTMRIDLGMKLYEASVGADLFSDYHKNALLSPAVARSAGLIVAFWNEVKNAPSVPPPPCAGPKPGGESPDDSVMVKASVAAQSATALASFDWHNVCRAGIGKGLTSMADYGVSSSLMEQLAVLDPNTDPTVAQAMYARLETLEEKYSGPQNVMPEDVKNAPYVSVWENGFGDSARSLVEGMREPVQMLDEPQEQVFTDEESLAALPPKRGLLDADAIQQRILILPTGSLYGLRSDSMEHQALQGFVEQGGVVVCMTQPYGDDFSALPVPAGETLEAAGFKQDLSCFSGSAYPTMDHPILSGITSNSVTAGFDGFFRTIPSGATILLRRTISGEPCMILYPVGQGYVVASTLYEDWGYANGQSTADGRSLVANIIAWAKNPDLVIPTTNLSSGGSASTISQTLHVRNLSDTGADQMQVLVMTPDRQTLVTQTTQAVSIPGHSEADVAVSVSLPALSRYGIFHADYRLLASNPTSGQEEEIQPQGESDSGRFVIESTGSTRQALSQTVFSTWTDDDVAGNPAKTVHIHLEDHTGTARTMHLWTCYLHETEILLDSIALVATLCRSGRSSGTWLGSRPLPGATGLTGPRSWHRRAT